MKKKIFLLCLLFAQMANAQRSSLHTSFYSGEDKKINDNGGDFINPGPINFFDHSSGSIIKWIWKFQGAKDGGKDSVLVYTKFKPVVSAKWNKSGNYKVELTTISSKGQSATLGVTVIIKFISTEPEEKKERKEYLSVFVSPTAEYLFPTEKGHTNQTFLGGMAGLIIKPHGKWTTNITVGYFLEKNVEALVFKKFSGIYVNLMVPTSKKGYIMLGPAFRAGMYTQGPKKGFAKAIGVQMNYVPQKSLTPKGSLDLRLQIASAVNLFDVSDIAGSVMILLDFGLR